MQSSFSRVLGATAGIVLLAQAGTAVAQTAGTLEVLGSAGSDSITISVGPAAGEVTLFGVPGVADGTVFTGVDRLAVSTFNGDDTVELDLEVAAIRVDIDTSTGADVVKVAQRTPPGAAELAAAFNFVTSTNADSIEFALESSAAEVDLDIGFRTDTNADQVKLLLDQQVPGTVQLDVDGTLGTNADSFELVAKGPALFVINGRVSGEVLDDILTAEIDGAAAGALVLSGDSGNDSVSYLAKAELSGAPRVLGGSNEDSLKLLVEGPLDGTPLLDGGAFFDSCDASPGVQVINCE
ncbi:MAG: hypothetical protein QNJ30_05440 [Kiloniellales bacterium]|nr:hypothetical protein [Kiloniellales bacterium]